MIVDNHCSRGTDEETHRQLQQCKCCIICRSCGTIVSSAAALTSTAIYLWLDDETVVARGTSAAADADVIISTEEEAVALRSPVRGALATLREAMIDSSI